MTTSDSGMITHTYTLFDGRVEVIVRRPILDDKTRQKREEEVKRAMALLGKEMVRCQKGGNEDVVHGRSAS